MIPRATTVIVLAAWLAAPGIGVRCLLDCPPPVAASENHCHENAAQSAVAVTGTHDCGDHLAPAPVTLHTRQTPLQAPQLPAFTGPTGMPNATPIGGRPPRLDTLPPVRFLAPLRQ